MLTVIVAGALTFPATSVQVPDAIWFAPDAVNTTGGEHEAIPEPPSTPVKVTVTSVLFQPFAFGRGDAVAVTTGGVLSILSVCVVAVALLPAASVTVTVPLTYDPSAVYTRGLGDDAETTPDRLSAVV